MTMVVNSFEGFSKLQSAHVVYIKDVNIKMEIYRDFIRIIDLDNALKAGKYCKAYTFGFDNAVNAITGMINFLDDLDFSEFVENCRAGKYAENSNRLEIIGVKYYESEKKACYILSPWAKVAKQNFTAGTINGVKMAKAILAGQVKEIICTGRFTDDFFTDAASDFSRGKKVQDLLDFANELLQCRKGFYGYATDNTKVLAIGWTYDSYKVVLN